MRAVKSMGSSGRLPPAAAHDREPTGVVRSWGHEPAQIPPAANDAGPDERLVLLVRALARCAAQRYVAESELQRQRGAV
jgi:hypothetical protein